MKAGGELTNEWSMDDAERCPTERFAQDRHNADNSAQVPSLAIGSAQRGAQKGIRSMKGFLALAILTAGATIAMSQTAAAAPDAANDPRIDPQVRSFLSEVNKDSSPFWTLPGPQVRAVLTGLQAKTPVDLSGVTISEKTISENDQNVKIYIVKPDKAVGRPPVLLFIQGGVWIAGNFENH
jgi:hypothetical protein